jgi:hypothetical protein
VSAGPLAFASFTTESSADLSSARTPPISHTTGLSDPSVSSVMCIFGCSAVLEGVTAGSALDSASIAASSGEASTSTTSGDCGRGILAGRGSGAVCRSRPGAVADPCGGNGVTGAGGVARGCGKLERSNASRGSGGLFGGGDEGKGMDSG